MSQPTLLVFPDNERWKNAFSFDHAMEHRKLMSVMGPLTQWSTMPYYIDPMKYDGRPSTMWHMLHEQAHTDFTSYLPAYAGVTPPGPGSSISGVGIPGAQNLVDVDFQRQDSQPWWTFANHQEHLIASNAIMHDRQAATVPWWTLPPRRVQVFW